MKTKYVLPIILIVLAVFLLGWKLFPYAAQKNTLTQSTVGYPGTISTSTTGQLMYTNNKLGLSFTFPIGWHLGDNNLGYGSLQLLNYTETEPSANSFLPGMNKIEAVITSVGSSTPDTGDYPKETMKSTMVHIEGQNVLKEVTSLNDNANQQFVSYYIPIPSELGKYLAISIFGDPANFSVLDNLVTSIKWFPTWKTFHDTTYGFESKYPATYSTFHSGGDADMDFRTVKECAAFSNATSVFPDGCEDYMIYIMDAPKDTVLGPSSHGFITSPIVVAGIQGEKVISPTGWGNWENMDQIVVSFSKDGKVYIQTFTFNHKESKEAEAVMDQILASFKFVK